MNWLSVDQTAKVLLGILFCIFMLIGSSCNPLSENVDNESRITLTPEIHVTPLSGELFIKVDVANLRSGPGVEFELIGTLSEGETVVIDGISAAGSWYRLADGSWIAADFVQSVPDEVTATAVRSTQVPLSPDTPTPTVTVAAIGTPLPPDTPTPTTTSAPTPLPPDTPTPTPTLGAPPTPTPS